MIKIKYNQETKSAHHVFYRRYKPNRNEDLDKLIASDSSETNSALASRTLFVNGLPPYLNVEGTRNVFNIFGQIEHVLMFEKPQSTPFSHISKGQGYFTPDESKSNSFKVAYIVYNQAGSVDKALKKLVTEERIVSTKQNPIPVGFKSMRFKRSPKVVRFKSLFILNLFLLTKNGSMITKTLLSMKRR